MGSWMWTTEPARHPHKSFMLRSVNNRSDAMWHDESNLELRRQVSDPPDDGVCGRVRAREHRDHQHIKQMRGLR